MTEQGLKFIEEFLKRVDIKGSEVPAFNLVLAELQAEREKLVKVKEILPKPKK